jgi:hypothetical protein
MPEPKCVFCCGIEGLYNREFMEIQAAWYLLPDYIICHIEGDANKIAHKLAQRILKLDFVCRQLEVEVVEGAGIPQICNATINETDLIRKNRDFFRGVQKYSFKWRNLYERNMDSLNPVPDLTLFTFNFQPMDVVL